ncbi:MAG: hypothetical protein IPG72_05515 [Ardenticatenales bacterium]|nr:hypothetical protein [Ardenticatenales bacterium]
MPAVGITASLPTCSRVTVTVFGPVNAHVTWSSGSIGSQRTNVSPRMPGCLRSSKSVTPTFTAVDMPLLPIVIS